MNTIYLSDWLSDGELIAAHYQQRIRKHSLGAKALDWRSDEEARQFFREGLRGVHADAVKTVFDVGCGKADLYPFLLQSGYALTSYAGIDVVPEFVERAHAEHSHIEVQQKNFVAFDPGNRKFDLVVNLGGLNSRMRHHESYLEHVIGTMAGMSTRYVAFNVLVDAELGFFPKGNQHRVGHITDVPSSLLSDIVARVAHAQGFIETVRLAQVFPKCHDAFVILEKHL